MTLTELRASATRTYIRTEAERLGVEFIVAYKCPSNIDTGRFYVVCRKDGIGRRSEYITWTAFIEGTRAAFVWGHYGLGTLDDAITDAKQRA